MYVWLTEQKLKLCREYRSVYYNVTTSVKYHQSWWNSCSPTEINSIISLERKLFIFTLLAVIFPLITKRNRLLIPFNTFLNNMTCIAIFVQFSSEFTFLAAGNIFQLREFMNFFDSYLSLHFHIHIIYWKQPNILYFISIPAASSHTWDLY